MPIDEYYDNGAFTADDYYELYIDWENANSAGGWIRVDGAGAGSPFNTWNDSFGGARHLPLTPRPGEISVDAQQRGCAGHAGPHRACIIGTSFVSFTYDSAWYHR